MIGIKTNDLRDFVVNPVLTWMSGAIPRSIPHDMNLLLGTAAQESRMGHYLDQTTPGPGPAYGPWQMEGATFRDHCDWMMRFNRKLWNLYLSINLPASFVKNNEEELGGNLYLACFMARVHYFRVKERLPVDLEGYAAYWKRYYNTYMGKGKESEFIQNYKELVGQ